MPPSPARGRVARLLLDTLRLRDPVSPCDLAAPWRALTERDAFAIAGLVRYEGAAIWLLRRLGDRGLLSHVRPALVDAFRRHARRDTALAMRVEAQAEAVLGRLAAWGVPAVLLKGVARRAAARLYPYADARTTIDVDLLVEDATARDLEERLRRDGYDYAAPPEATPEGLYHLRPLTLGGEPTVELHTSTSCHVPAAEAWRRARDGATDIEWRGRRVRVPCATELLWHAVTHALQDAPETFRLRYYLDAAVVLASGHTVTWPTIVERLRGPELPDRALALQWLRGAADLAGTDAPGLDGVPEVAESPVARALEWRLAVFGRLRSASRWREKLLDEGTRAQLGLPHAPRVTTRSLAIGARRRAATIAARGAYHLWRAIGTTG